MSLSSEEKRALRDKQKLLFSSGQFPLTGGAAARRRALKKRKSPLKTLLFAVGGFLVVVVALVVLVTKAARADEGTPPARIDVDIVVRGERPAPSVVFVDGGNALLRQRMQELSLEAGRENASLPSTIAPAGPPADVRVLRVLVEDGLMPATNVHKAVARAQAGLGACWGGLTEPGHVRIAVDVGPAGTVARVVVLADQTGRPTSYACAQQALASARWPSPIGDDPSTQHARVVVDLGLTPLRAAPPAR